VRHSGLEAHLLPHAREWHDIPRGVATSRNCRRIHKRLDDDEERYNRFGLIGRNSICKTFLGVQTFCFTLRFRQVIYGRQYEIVEIFAMRATSGFTP